MNDARDRAYESHLGTEILISESTRDLLDRLSRICRRRSVNIDWRKLTQKNPKRT
jgi:hypothetical protein